VFADRAHVDERGVDTLVVLEADGPIGRVMVEMAIQSHQPVVAVSLDPRALRLLQQDHPQADLHVLVGSAVDVRSAIWLADDLRNLKRRYSKVIAPIEWSAARSEDQPTSDALDVLRDQIQ